MKEYKFLRWLAENTESCWWHDSADPQELNEAIRNGAVGVTNPNFPSADICTMPKYI